ncbi:MAG: 30S ribosomal protein S6 [Patescibacteria group bacterium]
MRNYQLVLVVKTTSEANTKKVLETVKEYLKSAKITKQDDLGEKTLAYPIQKQAKGIYFSFLFEAEDITGLEKRLFANEDILRYLILRV